MDDLGKDQLRAIATMTAVPGKQPLDQLATVGLFIVNAYAMMLLKELQEHEAKVKAATVGSK